MEKILIVEDEENIRELVKYNLVSEGYNCIELEDGSKVLGVIEAEKPDLILLDIMLPGKDGYEICKELRMKGDNTPIIIVTAKTDEVDKVIGLEFGADDYLTKPFGVRELKARIKAVLRRMSNSASKKIEDSIVELDDIKISLDKREVRRGDEVIELPRKEFDLLVKLASNRGHVFSRDALLESVWGYDYTGETRTVDVHIRNLRKKLGGDETSGEYIKTVRGVGYKI